MVLSIDREFSVSRQFLLKSTSTSSSRLVIFGANLSKCTRLRLLTSRFKSDHLLLLSEQHGLEIFVSGGQLIVADLGADVVYD